MAFSGLGALRFVEMPTIECPAGQPLKGDSVLCGVLNKANEGESIGGFTARAQANPVMDERQDRGTVLNFCRRSEPCGGPAGYQHCAVWRAQRDMELARKKELVDRDAIVQHGLPEGSLGADPDALADAVDQAQAML